LRRAVFSSIIGCHYFSGSPRTFELPSAEITAIVNLVTTFILFAVVSTILLPILSGSVVLVQRRVDNSADYNTDYDTNSVTNPDNIDLAGGYYNSYQEDPYNSVEDPYNTASSNTNQNYYDPYYGYNYAGKYFRFNFFFFKVEKI
jgi:hypothetical protein